MLRIGCPGSLMSLYWPTNHIDLCIIAQCKLFISCIMSCGNERAKRVKLVITQRAIPHQRI